MIVKRITSRDNPVYREWLKLASDKRARKQQGRSLLEGPHLAQAALDAGVALSGWLLAESSQAAGDFDALVGRRGDIPVLVVPDNLFRALAPSTTPSGLLAMIATPAPKSEAAQFTMLLEDIQDPGNLGALIRCAAAAGVDRIHLSPGCAEAWSPKCLRGGQGAHFLVDIHEDADLASIARSGPERCHAAILGAPDSLYDLDLKGPCAIAFGNEGAGLSDSLRQLCAPFSIPMPGAVESLNVATAAAICLFERVRQKQAA